MHGNISGVIGLSNGITGSCAVFSWVFGRSIVASFLGEEIPLDDSIIHDGIGVVANMVAGGAKMRFANTGFNFSISTPPLLPVSLLSYGIQRRLFPSPANSPLDPDLEETFIIERQLPRQRIK